MVRFKVVVPAGFGAALKALRERRQWSVARLSKLSGVSATTIYEWEREAYSPSLGPLLQVLEALGVTMWVEEGEHDRNGH